MLEQSKLWHCICTQYSDVGRQWEGLRGGCERGLLSARSAIDVPVSLHNTLHLLSYVLLTLYSSLVHLALSHKPPSLSVRVSVRTGTHLWAAVCDASVESLSTRARPLASSVENTSPAPASVSTPNAPTHTTH